MNLHELSEDIERRSADIIPCCAEQHLAEEPWLRGAQVETAVDDILGGLRIRLRATMLGIPEERIKVDIDVDETVPLGRWQTFLWAILPARLRHWVKCRRVVEHCHIDRKVYQAVCYHNMHAVPNAAHHLDFLVNPASHEQMMADLKRELRLHYGALIDEEKYGWERLRRMGRQAHAED